MADFQMHTMEELLDKVYKAVVSKIPQISNYDFSITHTTEGENVIGNIFGDVNGNKIEIPFVMHKGKLLPVDMVKVNGKWASFRRKNIDLYFNDIGAVSEANSRSAKSKRNVSDPHNVMETYAMGELDPEAMVKKVGSELPEYMLMEKVGATEVKYWDGKEEGIYSLGLPTDIPEGYKYASLFDRLPVGMMDRMREPLNRDGMFMHRFGAPRVKIVRILSKQDSDSPTDTDDRSTSELIEAIQNRLKKDPNTRYTVDIQYINKSRETHFDTAEVAVYKSLMEQMPLSIFLILSDKNIISVSTPKFLRGILDSMNLAKSDCEFEGSIEGISGKFYIKDSYDSCVVGPFKKLYSSIISKGTDGSLKNKVEVVCSYNGEGEFKLKAGNGKQVVIDGNNIYLPIGADFIQDNIDNYELLTVYNDEADLRKLYNFELKVRPGGVYTIHYKGETLSGENTRDMIKDLFKIGFSSDDILSLPTRMRDLTVMPEYAEIDNMINSIKAEVKEQEIPTDKQPTVDNQPGGHVKQASITKLGEIKGLPINNVNTEIYVLNEMLKSAEIAYDDNEALPDNFNDTTDIGEAVEKINDIIDIAANYLFKFRLNEDSKQYEEVVKQIETTIVALEDFRDMILASEQRSNA